MQRPVDCDPARLHAPFLLQKNREVPSADEDLANRFASEDDAENPLGQVRQLARTEPWLLCLQAQNLVLDAGWGAVVGHCAAASTEGSDGLPPHQEPTAQQGSERAAKSLRASMSRLPQVADEEREAKGER
jgi:hypothetical protein